MGIARLFMRAPMTWLALLLVVGAAALVAACGQSKGDVDRRIQLALANFQLPSAAPTPAGGLSTGFDTAEPTETVQAELVAPPGVPPPVDRDKPAIVEVHLTVKEQEMHLANDTTYKFWTFNGSVPSPMIRVRAGDVVRVTLTNDEGSMSAHNIDLHAVNGPGGGAVATLVNPGETKGFEFKALAPGLYVYHCAAPPAPVHIANGMYGLILVEPVEGLPAVDKEFYIMQGEVYTAGDRGQTGLRPFSLDALLSENPEFVVFNGASDALVGDHVLPANVGETVRIYWGVGGPNLSSSFHIIGEIFDTVYNEGSFSNVSHNVQTTRVPPGGATAVEFRLDVPGTYLLVDHALGRILKGALGQLIASGEEHPEIFKPLQETDTAGH